MKKLKQILALVLVLCMTLSAVPFSAAAAVTLGTKPEDGTVTGEPFNDDASLSDNSPAHTNYRIPGLVRLNDGTLVATADIRYDDEWDGGGSDIVVSRSDDDGATWDYSVVAYLGDQGNVHALNASTMMDPVIITDGTNLYLLYDLFPAGYSLGGGSNTTYAFSATGTGFNNGKLILSTSYNSTAGGYYLDGDTIYTSAGVEVDGGYTVDEWFNVYQGDTWVSNLFYASDSPYYAYPTSYACMQVSTDGGDSWSAPEMLKTKHDGTKWQVLGPGSGIVTSSGELAFTVYNSDSSISLVHGTSGDWTTVKTSAATNESSVVELSDGTLRVFVKNGSDVITYIDFTKNGDTYTAGAAKSTGVSNTGWCMVSSMVYSKQVDGQEVILVCCPASSGLRRYGTVFAFRADNMSLLGSYQIDTGYDDQFFAYSDMVEMEDGTVALLYEDGCNRYNSAPWNGAAAGVGYSHISYTTFDPEEDLNVTFDATTVYLADSTGAAVSSAVVKNGTTATFTIKNLPADVTATAVSDNEGVVTAAVSGSTLTLTAVANGTATITLTAGDETVELEVTVADTSKIENILMLAGTNKTIDLTESVTAGSHTSDAADVTWGTTSVTTTYPEAQLGTTSAFSGDKIDLNDCLYTFTKNGSSWVISGNAGGTTVYVDAYNNDSKYPNRTASANVTITESGYTGDTDGAFILSGTSANGGEGSLHFHTQSGTYYWNQCSSAHAENNSNGTHGIFILKLDGTELTEVTTLEELTSGEQYLIAGKGGDGNYYVMHPTTADTTDQYAHLAKVTGTTATKTTEVNQLVITAKTAGESTSVVVGETTYNITVVDEDNYYTEEVDVPLVIGATKTVTLQQNVGEGSFEDSYAKVNWVLGGDLVAYGELRDSANNGTRIELSDSKYTFTDVGDGTYRATITKDGSTWYVAPNAKGHTTNQTAVTLTFNDNGSVYLNDTSHYLYVNRSSLAWDRTSTASGFETHVTFYLYGEGEDADSEIPGYKLITSVDEITSGEGYLIAFYGADGQLYVMNPTTRTASAYNQMAAVETVLENPTTTITIEGVSTGETSVIIGTTKYNIKVTEYTNEVDVALRVDQSKTFTIDGHAYTEDDVSHEPDSNVVTMAIESSSVAAGKELVEVTDATSITADKQYLLVSVRAEANEPNYSVLTSESYTSNGASWLGTLTGVAMKGPKSADSTDVWTITPSGTGYTISQNGSYLSIGDKSAAMTSSEAVFTMTHDSNGWLIMSNSLYLSDLAGTNLQGAFGFNDSSRDGDYWKIYEVATTPASGNTEVTFTGVSAGETYAIIGETKYNITVSDGSAEVREITLYVGVTKTDIIEDFAYDNTDSEQPDNTKAYIHSVTADITSGGKRLVAVTEIESGKDYLIVANRPAGIGGNTADSGHAVLTGTAADGGLYMSGPVSIDSTDLWTITAVTGGYTVKQGNNYLTIGNESAGTTTTETVLTLDYNSTGSGYRLGWVLQQGNYYLSDFQGVSSQNAYGYGTLADDGNYWTIYEIVEEPAEGDTKVVFSGVAAGETTAKVGHVTYNITVLDLRSGDDIEDFKAIVGQGTYVDGGDASLDMTDKVIKSLRITEGASFQLAVDVTDYESIVWSSADDSIATVSESGIVTAVKEGDALVTATVTKDGKTESVSVHVTVVPSMVSDGETSAFIFFYIDQVYEVDPFYTMYMSSENTTGPVENHEMVLVSENEVLWYERPATAAVGLVWTSDPWDGHALTYMAATDTAGQYYPLQVTNGVLGSGTVDGIEYYKGSTPYNNVITRGEGAGADWQESLDALLEYNVHVGEDIWQEFGCDGAMSMTRNANDDVPAMVTSLSFVAEKLPEVEKTVNGVLGVSGLKQDWEVYQDGMYAEVGEYVYFDITITQERPHSWQMDADGNILSDDRGQLAALQYLTGATLIDELVEGNGTPYFYTKDLDPDSNGYIDDVSLQTNTQDVTADLNAGWTEDEINAGQRVLTYYVVYEIQSTDANSVITNGVALDYDYSSMYSSGTHEATGTADAQMIILGQSIGDGVVDFGLPVVIEGLTTNERANEFDEENTNNAIGGAKFGYVDIDEYEVDGETFWRITYTPDAVLTTYDVVYLMDANNELVNYFRVYPATTVTYEEGFIEWDSNWSGASMGSGTQATEDLGKKTHVYGYDPAYVGDAAGTSAATATAMGARGMFSFTGTGFDIYANNTTDGGYVAVQVQKVVYDLDENGNLVTDGEGNYKTTKTNVKLYMIDTAAKAGYTDVTAGQGGSFNGLTLISERGLPHGVYEVSIVKIMESEKPVTIDGFRVYGTYVEEEGENSIFFNDDEDHPDFYQLRDYVLSGLNVAADTSIAYKDMYDQVYGLLDASQSAVILNPNNPYGDVGNGSFEDEEGNEITVTPAADLLDNGPKNELFLRAGQSLVFSVSTNRVIQIGLKTPAGATNYSISYTVGDTTENVATNAELNSKTDMFYKVADKATAEQTYVITVTNNGTNVLSVTDLKICDAPGASFQPLTARDVSRAMVELGYVDSEIPEVSFPRFSGPTRFETAIATAEMLKSRTPDGKFENIIITNGYNFADALAGSYLAIAKEAPILLTHTSDSAINSRVLNYISENIADNGIIYILGGTAAVPESISQHLENGGYTYVRLSGKSRYETNLKILKEVGVSEGQEILVCTGNSFADSLSASATGLPILLVNKELTAEQKTYLEGLTNVSFTIIGGTGAVSADVQTALEAYGEVERIYGANRFETSVLVAEEYFPDPNGVVLAYAWNFPDGLCGGVLAYAAGAPLVLTAEGGEQAVCDYVRENGYTNAAVMGGTSLISDELVETIMIYPG